MTRLILFATALASFPGFLRAQLAQPPPGVTEGVLKESTNACPANPDLAHLDASPVWSGWGGTGNARFQTKAAAGLTAADVPKLKLKWTFGFPGAKSMYSQPSVAFGRVFVGSDNGVVYSLDAKTGCVYWAYQADMFGRFAPIAAPISGHSGTRYAIFFVTRSTTAYALDAHDGKLLWKAQVRTGLNNLSATAAYHDGRLYVPMSGTETLVGANLNYECCKSRGAVAALDAKTGKVRWVTQSIPEPLRELGENANGKQRWGPAGASVWNTPTVDAKRGLIYVGTGNSFGRIAATTSDSILALRMKDGKLMWHHQEFAGDAFMARCQATNGADSNCAEKPMQDDTAARAPGWHATTILMVRKGDKVVIGGDGQVSMGQTVVKATARKVRRLAKGEVIAGFAGATADAFTLFERLEAKLEQYPGQLARACVELAKDWRTDRYLRRLEAMLLVADKGTGFTISGAGDVLEPEADENGSAMAIGSGGNYALAAARALMPMALDAEEIVRRSMRIAADICVYTNANLIVESL